MIKINLKSFFVKLLNKSGKEKITIVILTGILLLVISIPTGKKSENKNTQSGISCNEQSDTYENYDEYIEKRLEKILGQVKGVGEISVVVTLKNTSEKIIAKDTNTSNDTTSEIDSSGGQRTSSQIENQDTNVFGDTVNGSEPYVVMENMPQIEGIAVVCSGGDDPLVKTEVTQTVEALLDVPAHKIKVLRKN